MLPFNKPYLIGTEIINIQKAHELGQLSGDGHFTQLCNKWMVNKIGVKHALLTHSCTAALEMAAILSNIGPGDEVIMPSYTFVSTANAFVLRGATPVFVDIRPDTKNINELLIEQAITPKTKVIVVVHYAGVACEMDAIQRLAKKYRILLVEDASQAILSTYKNQPLGTLSDFSTISFHETKNIICGEGGALLINNSSSIERAEIIREKGTNRRKFFKGEVDKYSWVDIGSSYLPGEIIAAFLWAQLQESEKLTEQRINIWNRYHVAFMELEKQEKIMRPVIPKECGHNGHMYYLLLPNSEARDIFIRRMREQEIQCVFHYSPLHKSEKGIQLSRVSGSMTTTEDIEKRLVRLPLWLGIERHLDFIIDSCYKILK